MRLNVADEPKTPQAPAAGPGAEPASTAAPDPTRLALDRYAELRSRLATHGDDPVIHRELTAAMESIADGIATPAIPSAPGPGGSSAPPPLDLSPEQRAWAAWRVREDALKASGMSGSGLKSRADGDLKTMDVGGLNGAEILARYEANTRARQAAIASAPAGPTPDQRVVAEWKARQEQLAQTPGYSPALGIKPLH